MTPLFALATISVPEASAVTEVFGWDWTRTHRFYIESQVHLPLYMWLGTPNNHQARVTSFDLRLVTTCADAAIETKHVVEVTCTLDDVALSAAAYPADEGLVQKILDVVDQDLTGAQVQLQMHDDGRLSNIDLEGLDRRNPRAGRINENLRQIVTRAFAGLDFELPTDHELAWPQYQAWLMRAPSSTGSSGGAEVVHREIDRADGFVHVMSAGRGVIYPGEGVNKYDTRMTSDSMFDLRTGRLADRTWTVVGGPTASSLIAQGAAGYPYLQRGRVVALPIAENMDVGDSVELETDAAQTAIQAGFTGVGYPQR
jgi:hypothetical protein